MAKNRVKINNFGGIASDLDPALIGWNAALDIENYDILNNKLVARNGFTSKVANIAGNTGSRGLEYVRGYDSTSTNFYENYLYIYRTATNLQAKLYNVNSFSPTALTFSTPVTTDLDQYFDSISYDQDIIFTNSKKLFALPFGSTTIRELSGFAPPTGQMSVVSDPNYNLHIPWSGWAYTTTNNNNVITAGTSGFNNSIIDGGTTYTWNSNHYYINGNTGIQFNSRQFGNYASSSTCQAKIEMDLSSLTNYTSFKNIQYRDEIEFFFLVDASNSASINDAKFTTTFDSASFKITFVDVNGIEVNPEKTVFDVLAARKNLVTQVTPGGGSIMYMLQASWANKIRSTSPFDWTQVKKIRIEFTVNFPQVTSGNQVNKASYFKFLTCDYNAVNLTETPKDQTGKLFLNFGIARYNATLDVYSPVSNTITITSTQLIEGTYYDSNKAVTGNWLNVTFPIDNDGSATQTVLFVQDASNLWRKLTAVNNSAASTATYSFRYNANDVSTLAAHSAKSGDFSNINCLTTHRGWVVYGQNSHSSNIRHAKIGSAFTLYDPLDESEAAGADYTLSESFADTPQAMTSFNSTLLIWGQEGVYAQSGDRPSIMSPTQKLPNLQGIANRLAFCSYNDPQYGQGAIYVTQDGRRAYFIYADATSIPVAYRTIELTEAIRNDFYKYMVTDSLAGGLSKIRVNYRHETDQIVISSGRNAFVWEKADITTQKRNTVRLKTANTDATFDYITTDVLSNGTAQTIFAPSGTGVTLGLFDSSVYTDFGSTINCYYQSGDNFSEKSYRVSNVFIDKNLSSKDLGITFYSTRQPSGETIQTSTKSDVRFSPLSQGFKQSFKISESGDNTSGFSALLIDIISPMADRKGRVNI